MQNVLLSPDLAPFIFQALAVRDCAAAAVCSEWARQWAEKVRRVPRLTPMDVQPEPPQSASELIVALPDQRLMMSPSCHSLAMYDVGTMKRLATLGDEEGIADDNFTNIISCTADDDSLYVTNQIHLEIVAVRRLTMDGTAILAHNRFDIHHLHGLVLAPGRRLFAVALVDNEYDNDDDTANESDNDGDTVVGPEVYTEVWCLDADSLERRYIFAHWPWEYIGHRYCFPSLTICGDELMVGCAKQVVHVFSFSGERRRQIQLDFTPQSMLAVDDRLYLIEYLGNERRICGQRIVVLSPAGTRLHVVKDPYVIDDFVSSNDDFHFAYPAWQHNMCRLGGRLLICGIRGPPDPSTDEWGAPAHMAKLSALVGL